MLRILHVLLILAMLVPAVPVQRGYAQARPQELESTPTPTPETTPDSGSVELLTPTATISDTLITATPTITYTQELPTATITPTLETPTPEPVELTSTPTVTSQPTATSTWTLTESPTPSPEPSSTPTPMLATAIPTPTITSTVDVSGTLPGTKISLNLQFDPQAITPGKLVHVSWSIVGFDATELAKALILIHLPPGFEFVDDQAVSFDPGSGLLTIPADREKGSLSFSVPKTLYGPYSVHAELIQDERILAEWNSLVQEAGVSAISLAGGTAASLAGDVRVIFPSTALKQSLQVRVRSKDAGELPVESLSGHPFEILAIDPASGEEVHKFEAPFTIEVDYSGRYDNVWISTLDEEEFAWVALPTTYDPAEGVLRATVDHLSVFDIDYQDWQMARMPGVDASQVSDFTGAGTYSYPIWTPPGPAGHQPSLSLTYNSQIVDGAYSPRTQGDWVGMGWSLEVGAIERDMHGTMLYAGGSGILDDTFLLSVNGISSRIIKDSNGIYRLADEQFMKIEYSGDFWTVYDKVGNKYIFGKDLPGQYTYSTRARYPEFDGCSNAGDQTWKWMLTEAVDKYGNRLEYYYTKENGNAKNRPNCTGSYAYTRAIYPTEIRYVPDQVATGSARYRIFFDLDTTSRTDYDTDWTASALLKPVFFQMKRLKTVRVVHDSNGAGTAGGETVARKYELFYDDNVFPNWQWPAGGYSFTLTKIRETGLSAQTWPDMTFVYDNLHLLSVDNGFGGEVDFHYLASDPWYEIDADDDYVEHIVEDEAEAYQGYKFYDFARDTVRPGGKYKVVLSIKNTQTSAQDFNFGVVYDSAGYYVPLGSGTYNIPANTTRNYEWYVTVPSVASTSFLQVRIYSSKYLVISLDVVHTSSRYRVDQKDIGDDLTTGEDLTYKYAYDGAATNTCLADALWEPYTPNCLQFNGHAMTRLTSPGAEKLTTLTWYHQDKILKGRAHARMDLKLNSWGSGEAFDDFEYYNTGVWAESDSSGTQTYAVARNKGDQALKITNAANWNANMYRLGTITNSQMTLVQFYVEQGTPQVVLALESGTRGTASFWEWDIYVTGTRSVVAREIVAGAVSPYTPVVAASATLLGDNVFQYNTWYTLLFIVDDDSGFYTRLWPTNDAASAVHYLSAFQTGRSWTFKFWTYGGTAWMDTYAEGKLYNFSVSDYSYAPPTSPTLLKNFDLQNYPDLYIAWTRPEKEYSWQFEGQGSGATGQATYYDYVIADQGGVRQYGDLTRRVVSSQTSIGASWTDYRIEYSNYYPNTAAGQNLVGLPGFTNVYKCPSGAVNGACKTSFSTASSELLTSDIFIYDSNAAYTNPPTAGVLWKTRHLLRFAGAGYTDPRYADTLYTYDIYGNPATVTAYATEGTSSTFSTGGARTTTYCYGLETGTSCTADAYHTYLGWEKNALNQYTRYQYDYSLGLPTRMQDPNDQYSYATYDGFGRVLTVARPPDTTGAPTISFTYTNPSGSTPYYVQATQRINASTNYVMRQYYDGLGRLLQTRLRSALLGTLIQDVQMDSFYDAAGRQYQQSAPYAVSTGAAFARSSAANIRTTTGYDVLGRVVSVLAPDGTYPQRFTYNLRQVLSKDARNNQTTTSYDAWGRATSVTPPTGPGMAYTYDYLDRLLTAQQGSLTAATITYDNAGRKVSMSDPDMGSWSYTYDAVGNLKTQTDARNCITTINYDSLNRPTGKTYSAVSTCQSTAAVTYTYDSYDPANQQWGRGYRTGMTDGSGSTSWRYDQRGRLRLETKAITGSGTFLTEWSYNSADLLDWIKYPGGNASQSGEQVSFTYHPQMLLKTAIGSTTYLKSADYDAAGRVDLFNLGLNGSNPYVKLDYAYNAWNVQGGRMQTSKSGTPSSPISLQDLEYHYDAAGNIDWINDYKAGSPQTQTFTYDSLNRINSASATGTAGGNGAYNSETYVYDTAGRLSSNAGITLSYNAQEASCQSGALSKPHAVTQFGTNKYCYDLNGNMVKRSSGSNTYTLAFDVENRLTSVTGSATNAYIYNGDGQLVKEVAYENLAYGLPVTSDTTIYWPTSAVDNDIYADSGTGSSGEFAYTGSGLHYAQVDLGEVYTVDKVKVWHYFNGGRTYHNTKTQVSSDGVNWYTVFDSASSGEYAETSAGRTYTFPARSVRYVRDWLNGSTANTSNHWVEIEVYGSRTNVHIGNWFEWTGSTSTMKKYYYAGATRIAMRTGSGTGTTGLKWLLGDHLGSTAIVAEGSSGALVSELRYKPWGELRYAYQPTPTDLRYTGQRSEGIGLYFYQSRWYDPQLGRFVQPDTIVPLESQGVQAWDRYAYVNNNPVRSTDPTGHCKDLEDCFEKISFVAEKIGQVMGGEGIENSDWVEAADLFFPATSDGSQLTFTAIIGVGDKVGLVEQNFVMSASGEYQFYDTNYVDGLIAPQAGLSISGGPIYGEKFGNEGTSAYKDGAAQVFGGISIIGGDAWTGVDETYLISGVFGVDMGVSLSTGLSVGAIGVFADPVSEPQQMSGPQLFLCRGLGGCGN